MSLSTSGEAIGALTRLIANHILNVWDSSNLTKPEVSIGRPEESDTNTNTNKPRLNLFLYELKLDPFLRNTSLGPGRQPPLWLVARCLLTAFDKDNKSDTEESLRYLGEGIRILASSLTTIEQINNPEILKLTIEDVGVEMLSRLMQGPDQKYRLSAGFEVRPIMIEPLTLTSYSLLVGVDYTKNPILEIGDKGIKIDVDSLSIPPVIVDIEPKKFELGTAFYINGRSLDLSDLSVYIDSPKFDISLKLDIIQQKRDKLECIVESSDVDFPLDENSIVASNYSLYLIQNLTQKRRRKSNAVIGSLIPTIDSAIPNSLTTSSEGWIEGQVNILGSLLGRHDHDGKAVDDMIVGLQRNGRTTNVVTRFTFPTILTGPPPQHNVILDIKKTDKVAPGVYRLIYTVNGQQAKNSPEVTLELP